MEFIAFVRKHYTPEGIKNCIQRQKNKNNVNPAVGFLRWAKSGAKYWGMHFLYYSSLNVNSIKVGVGIQLYFNLLNSNLQRKHFYWYKFFFSEVIKKLSFVVFGGFLAIWWGNWIFINLNMVLILICSMSDKKISKYILTKNII